MNDSESRILVEIKETSRDSDYNVEALLPIQFKLPYFIWTKIQAKITKNTSI